MSNADGVIGSRVNVNKMANLYRKSRFYIILTGVREDEVTNSRIILKIYLGAF